MNELDRIVFKNDLCKKDIYLEKGLVLGNKISIYAKLAYTALRLYIPRKDYVVYEYLKYILSGSLKPNKPLEQKIKQGISELIKKKYIQVTTSTNIGAEIILDNLYFETKRNSKYFKPFIIISIEELHSIMNLKRQSPENILLYFCGLVSTMNNSSHLEISDKSIAYLAKLSKVSKSSVIRYNEILCANDLLHIEKSNQANINSKGQIISSLPNIYSRPKNKSIAKAEQLSREQKQGNIGHKNLSTNANKKRSLAMKLNQIKKGNGNYSLDEITEIIRCIENEIHNIDVEIKKRYDENERCLLSEKQLEEQVKALNEESQRKKSDLELVQEFYNKTELRINDEHDEQFLATLEDNTLDYNIESDTENIDINDMDSDDNDSFKNVETQIIEIIKKYYYPYLSQNDLAKLRKHKKDYEIIKTTLFDSKFRSKFDGLVTVGILLENVEKEIEKKSRKKDHGKEHIKNYIQYQKWLKDVKEGKYRIKDVF